MNARRAARGTTAVEGLWLVVAVGLAATAGLAVLGSAVGDAIDPGSRGPAQRVIHGAVGVEAAEGAAGSTSADPPGGSPRELNPPRSVPRTASYPFARSFLGRLAFFAAPVGALVHGPGDTGRFWAGLAGGVVHWVEEVGGGFLDLFKLLAKKPQNDLPAPFNYPAAWLTALWGVVTHPMATARTIADAGGVMAGHLGDLGRGCLMNPGDAGAVGAHCGELTAEVASFYIGGEFFHRFMHSKFAGPLRHGGGFEEHAAELAAAKTAARLEKRAVRREKRAARWSDRRTGAQPHHADDTAHHAHHADDVAHDAHQADDGVHVHAEQEEPHAHGANAHAHAHSASDEAREWLRNRVVGIAPHLFIDDGPRFVLRGARRDEEGLAGSGTAAHGDDEGTTDTADGAEVSTP